MASLRVVLIATCWVLAAAFDWSRVAMLDRQGWACLEQRLDPAVLGDLAVGIRPSDPAVRTRAREAFAACHCEERPAAYDGVLFDAMARLDPEVDMVEAMEGVLAAGVGKVALFAPAGSRPGAVLDLVRRYPDLVVAGTPGRKLAANTPAGTAPMVEALSRRDYRFVGEALTVAAPGEGLDRLLQGLAEAPAVPVMSRWLDWRRDLPRLDAVFARWRDRPFLVPHMAFGEAAAVRALLDRHPNLHVTWSRRLRPGDGMVGRCGGLDPAWRALLVDHADRVLFATDASDAAGWAAYADRVAAGRRVLGQLPAGAAALISHGNAERLFGVDTIGP